MEETKEEGKNRLSEKVDLQKELEECQRQKQEYLAGWQRARADFINYKKEEMERIQELIGYAKEEFLLNILPILDSFDQAEKKIPEQKLQDEEIRGLLQIKNQLLNYLKRLGVEEMKIMGEKFDPNLHEVTVEEEKAGIGPGTIIEEVQKGYMIGDRVLRAAKVKVAK